MIDIVLMFIVLHGPDGREINVSVDQITSIHCSIKSDDDDNKLFPDGVHAVLSMSDGKRIAVVEACNDIKKQLEGQK